MKTSFLISFKEPMENSIPIVNKSNTIPISAIISICSKPLIKANPCGPNSNPVNKKAKMPGI